MEYGFKAIHPVVQIMYFLFTLIAIMLLPHPIVLGIFTFCLSGYLIRNIGLKKFFKNMKIFLLLSLVLTIINPLFNQRGRNIVFQYGSRVITLEAIIYGFIMSLMFISIILLFQIFNLVVDSHKFIYVFSKIAPKSAFLSNMALRYMPLMRSRFQELLEINIQSEIDYSLKDKVKVWGKVLSVLVTWSFEEAIITADSMKSRGYGLTKRTNYRIYRWKTRDYAVLAILGTLLMGIMIFKFNNILSFTVYPRLDSLVFNPLNILAFIVVMVLSMMPYLIDEKENYKWRNLN